MMSTGKENGKEKLLYVVTKATSTLHSCGEYCLCEHGELVKVFKSLTLAQHYVNQIPKRDRIDYRIEEVESEGF